MLGAAPARWRACRRPRPWGGIRERGGRESHTEARGAAGPPAPARQRASAVRAGHNKDFAESSRKAPAKAAAAAAAVG